VNASSKVGADCLAGALSHEVTERLIVVEDTLNTLQELARWHRSMTFVDGKPLRVIALTGTNGKTTTKELIREVLSVKYNVLATEGNLNNNIGVPLTLLRIGSDTQLAVVEMGASHPGDIKELVDIALPNYGLITNVGKAHLLGFGSFEGVKATKGELYDYLRRTADKAFINVDNPHLLQMASERNMQHDPERPDSLLIPYGLEYQGASVLPASSVHPFLRVSVPSVSTRSPLVIDTNLIGAYNADNVMAALAVGQYFGVSLEDAAHAIESYVPTNNRSQMQRTERNTLIVDAYNANPTSMAAALDNFAAVAADYKVALLGDMLELGADSLAEHKAVIEAASAGGFAMVCFVGKEFAAITQAGFRGAALGEYAGIAGDLAEVEAVLGVAHGVDFLKVALAAGEGGESGEGLHLQRVLAADPGAGAFQSGDGGVAVAVIAQTGLVELPDQLGIYLEMPCDFLRRLELAALVFFFQCSALRQDFFSCHTC